MGFRFHWEGADVAALEDERTPPLPRGLVGLKLVSSFVVSKPDSFPTETLDLRLNPDWNKVCYTSRVAMSREILVASRSLKPAAGHVRPLRALAFLFGLLLPAAAVADQALLSYSLSSIPAAANNFWQTSRRNHEQAAEQAAPLAYETPGWAQQGVRDLRFSLYTESSSQARASRLIHPAIGKLQAGIGDYFPHDTVGKAHLTGTAVEDLRWIYFKIKILGRR